MNVCSFTALVKTASAVAANQESFSIINTSPFQRKANFQARRQFEKKPRNIFFQISRLRKRDSRMWKIWIESQFGKKDLITICKQKEKWKKISILCKIKILLRFWWRLFLPTILIWLIDRQITFQGISMVSGLWTSLQSSNRKYF